MLSRDSGLTKTYNLVFDPTCTDQDIEELRRIHRAIDLATIRAYGWEDRIEQVGGLDHGFHKVGRETRYTIGPAAQCEILDSLLELLFLCLHKPRCPLQEVPHCWNLGVWCHPVAEVPEKIGAEG